MISFQHRSFVVLVFSISQPLPQLMCDSTFRQAGFSRDWQDFLQRSVAVSSSRFMLRRPPLQTFWSRFARLPGMKTTIAVRKQSYYQRGTMNNKLERKSHRRMTWCLDSKTALRMARSNFLFLWAFVGYGHGSQCPGTAVSVNCKVQFKFCV